MTWRSLCVAPILALAAACGGSPEEGRTVTGRVTTRDAEHVCVSRDPRRATSDCVAVDDLVEVDGLDEVDVGECASITAVASSTGERGRVEVVDEAACAAGDLDGDD